MDRRQFLATTGALAFTGLPGAARAAQVTLSANPTATATVPADFLGLSYETPQLYNPDYFSPRNRALVSEFRAIAPRGVLRFGGSLSAYTRWQRDGANFASDKEDRAIAAQHNWEWKLLDPAIAGSSAGAITPRALEALRGFLDATGWRCIYGLNFGSGSVARAVDEADHVIRILGSRLLCFQLGNEPDFWAGNPLLRGDPYPFEQYWREYQSFVTAIRARRPRAPFAGPDAALNLDWVARFAERARGDARFVCSHFYAMGPASDPAMNAERLLSASNPRFDQQQAAVAAMTAATGMRFRLTEANSCFGGGKPGVSNAFASALWGADFMLTAASAGYLGVDLHGGGNGYYTPLEAGPSGPVGRPLFHAMRFASAFAGARIWRWRPAGEINAGVFTGERGGERLIALVNKSPAPLTFAAGDLLGRRQKPHRALLLHAPALDDLTGTRLDAWPIPVSDHITVPRFSAMLVGAR